MAEEEVVAAEEVAGSETEEVVAGSDPTSEGAGSAAAGAFESPFTFGWHDGTQWEITDRAQLAQKLQEINEERRHSTMRHEDLEKAKAEVAAQREAMEAVVKRARDTEERANSSYSRYKPWDDLMNSNPALRQEIEAAIDRHKNGGRQDMSSFAKSVFDQPEFQEIKSGMEEWKKGEAQRAKERAIVEADKALATLEGYDPDAVTQFAEELTKVPQQDGERKLREVLHYALRGMQRAGVLEKRTGGAPKKPNVTSTPGKSTTGPSLDQLSEEEQEAEIIRRLKELDAKQA